MPPLYVRKPSAADSIEADSLSACPDAQATQKFARIPVICLQIPSIFLYLAYMQYKPRVKARNCAAAVPYGSHPASTQLKWTACQPIQTHKPPKNLLEFPLILQKFHLFFCI